MATTVNIAVAVDVIGALSDRALEGHLFMMDDSVYGSDGKGTSKLITACCAGQIVCWSAYAVDLQTPISIRKIDFLGCCSSGRNIQGTAKTSAGGDVSTQIDHLGEWRNDLKDWRGIVPSYLVPGADYRYRLEIQMGVGKNSVMTVDTPALRQVTNTEMISASA